MAQHELGAAAWRQKGWQSRSWAVAQQLRAEKASYVEQLSMLGRRHGLLAEENRGLGERPASAGSF